MKILEHGDMKIILCNRREEIPADFKMPENSLIIDKNNFKVLKFVDFISESEPIFEMEKKIREINQNIGTSDYYSKFDFQHPCALLLTRNLETLPNIKKIDSYLSKAKEKYSVNSIYFCVLEKSLMVSENIEFLEYELSFVNPKIVFVDEKEEEVEDWIKELLKVLNTKYKI